MKIYINVEWRLDKLLNIPVIMDKSWVCDETDWVWSYELTEDFLGEWILASVPDEINLSPSDTYRQVLEVDVEYYYSESISWDVTLKKMAKLEEIPFTFVEECINILPQTE